MVDSDAWSRARYQFKEGLADEEAALFEDATFENVFYGTSAAEKNHRTNSSIRHLATKLNKLFVAINQYGEALDVVANASSMVLCPLWGGIRVIIHLSAAFEKYFERTVDILSKIGDVVPRFRVCEHLYPDRLELVQALAAFYLDILQFCTTAKAAFQKAKYKSVVNARILLNLSWRPVEQQFESMLKNFRRHEKQVEKEAKLSHMIESHNSNALEKFNWQQVQKQTDEAEQIRLISMLSSIQWEKQHDKLYRVRHKGTGEWIQHTQAYMEWKDKTRSSCLWVTGIPGCGKSILAASVAETLKLETNSSTSVLAYYYCDHADYDTLEASNILGTIAQQLLITRNELPESIVAALRDVCGNGIKSPSPEILLTLLVLILNLWDIVYILIDGLDECSRDVQADILPILNTLLRSDSALVKIYLSSRDIDAVRSSPWREIRMSEASLSADIASFIKDVVTDRLQHHPVIQITHTCLLK